MFLSQGASAPEMFNDIHPRYERWLKMFGFTENYLIRALGVQAPGEVKDKPGILDQARELARKLVG
jgi:hypothetical protein